MHSNKLQVSITLATKILLPLQYIICSRTTHATFNDFTLQVILWNMERERMRQSAHFECRISNYNLSAFT